MYKIDLEAETNSVALGDACHILLVKHSKQNMLIFSQEYVPDSISLLMFILYSCVINNT